MLKKRKESCKCRKTASTKKPDIIDKCVCKNCWPVSGVYIRNIWGWGFERNFTGTNRGIRLA